MTNQPFSSANQMYLNLCSPHHRSSAVSLSLEEGGDGCGGGGVYHFGIDHMSPPHELEEDESCSFLGSISRSIRRQKNMFLFGSRKEKAIRMALVIYLILIHFYAFEYYLG